MIEELPQHMVALERANQIRLARAELKRRIRAGRVTVPMVLHSTPRCALTMTVIDLLTAQQRWGDVRARKLLARLAIPERRVLGNLTLRQRRLLIDELPRAKHSTGRAANLGTL